MFQLLFTALLFVSVGTILFLFVRAVPRVSPEEASGKSVLKRLEELVTGDLPEKIDALLTKHSTKALHRTKITLMKVDNSLGRVLRRLRENTGASSSADFTELQQDAQKTEEDVAK